MKVWVIKSPRKKSFVWLVKAYDPLTGKTKDLETFAYNEKNLAKNFAEEKRSEQPENIMPADVSFNFAFKEYKEKILADTTLRQESRLVKCGYINNHIAPYINKKVKFD